MYQNFLDYNVKSYKAPQIVELFEEDVNKNIFKYVYQKKFKTIYKTSFQKEVLKFSFKLISIVWQ